MVDLLGFVDAKLNEIGVPYEFGEWTKTVSYPYFVGTYTATEYRFEDGCTVGNITLDGWSRGSGGKLALAEMDEKIKAAFEDLTEVQEESLFFIRYGGCLTISTGEEDLHRITITLYTNEWKGR